MDEREQVQRDIMSTLTQLKPNAPSVVIAKLPGMAKRMEENLWLLARSADEFLNPNTLKERIMEVQQKNTNRLLKRPSPSSSSGYSSDNKSQPGRDDHVSCAQADNAADIKNTNTDTNTDANTRLSEAESKRLFGHLQAWRNRTVQEEGMGPWDIVPTYVLAQAATFCPRDMSEIEACCGFEQSKEKSDKNNNHHRWIQTFGPSLLRQIRQFVHDLTRKDKFKEKNDTLMSRQENHAATSTTETRDICRPKVDLRAASASTKTNSLTTKLPSSANQQPPCQTQSQTQKQTQPKRQKCDKTILDPKQMKQLHAQLSRPIKMAGANSSQCPAQINPLEGTTPISIQPQPVIKQKPKASSSSHHHHSGSVVPIQPSSGLGLMPFQAANINIQGPSNLNLNSYLRPTVLHENKIKAILHEGSSRDYNSNDMEVSQLRMLLQKTQQENRQLHAEIAYLRQQLQLQQQQTQQHHHHQSSEETMACQALVACQSQN